MGLGGGNLTPPLGLPRMSLETFGTSGTWSSFIAGTSQDGLIGGRDIHECCVLDTNMHVITTSNRTVCGSPVSPRRNKVFFVTAVGVSRAILAASYASVQEFFTLHSQEIRTWLCYYIFSE